MSYAESGDFDRSVAAFAAAVKHTPDNAEFRTNYAFALSTKGNLDDALREYTTAITLDPGNRYVLDAIQEIKMQKTGGSKQTATPFSAPGKK